MNKLAIILTAFFLSVVTGMAQNYEWAFTSSKAPRSSVAALKRDHSGNVYLATNTDSTVTRLYAQLTKYDLNQQVSWQKQLNGTVTIADAEITATNHVVVTGYFEDSVNIDGTLLLGSAGIRAGFIFKCDENGVMQWVHLLNQVSFSFEPVDLFIAADGNMYLTSSLSGGPEGFCAFHKLDSLGSILKDEYNYNFDNRTFSHILADSAGNVYLSGTCGNFGSFDTLLANPGFSYQNFLVKYDSSFKAQWLITKKYATFDHNNALSMQGGNLHWVFSEINSVSGDTIKIIKTDFSGTLISVLDGPMPTAFFPGISYGTDATGNSTLVLEVFVGLYIFRYDTAFNILWQDTIQTQFSGSLLNQGLACYDSSFYLAAMYINDTLMVDQFTLLNPNIGTNFPSDVFVCKWKWNQPTAVDDLNRIPGLTVFPNPASSELTVTAAHGDQVIISDLSGKIIYSEQYHPKIDVSHFAQGIYFLKVLNSKNEIKGVAKVIVGN